MISFHFDRNKTIQAVAYILNHRPKKRMKYLLLLKVLYMADRVSLAETLQPITGDAVYAMKYGPVLTHVYDMIGKPAEDWDNYIETDEYDLVLKADPGTGRLSEYEMELIRKVADRFDDGQRWDVVELTHEFPEWKDHYRDATSTRIPVCDIIRAVGREEDLAVIEEETQEASMMAELFGD